ncbi:unnamed protein product [Cylindrotheca closterium]|uniref:GAG-pre-integrase domain-containing protein n=1 Tax=Cylindrotheca closterium TaxID=2856 RepID=A0AAD2FK98_9STRA|nr:unnamed protein product [Cylindrotheca closterium]
MNDNKPSTSPATTSRETPHDQHQRRRPGNPNWTFYQDPRQRGEDDAFCFDPPRPQSCCHESSRHRSNRHNPSSNPSDNIFRHFNTFPRADKGQHVAADQTCHESTDLPLVSDSRSHVAILSSPAAKAFFKNADIPQQFSKVINCFCAAMNPDELRSDMSGDEKTARYPIIWDSGATTSISPYKDDFVGKLEPAPLGLKLCGIASRLKIEGIGHVAWSVVDTTGMLRTIKVPALYVPSATARLLSTSSLLQTYTDESISMNADHLQLSGSDKTNPVHVDHDPSTNLPTSLAYSHGTTPNRFDAFASIITSTLESNHNLSPAEKELLRWHHRLGHLNFSQIQFLRRTGVLAHSESAPRLQAAASRITTYQLCPACQFGKQRRRPSPGKTSQVVRD